MKDLNSAAQVSTFLNTGKILRAVLFCLIISSEVFVNSANFLSEKPMDFILFNSFSSIKGLKRNPLMVCPTVYCKSFAKGDIKNNEYLKVLAREIDPSISILWTGDEVVSQSIPQKGIKELKSLFYINFVYIAVVY